MKSPFLMTSCLYVTAVSLMENKNQMSMRSETISRVTVYTLTSPVVFTFIVTATRWLTANQPFTTAKMLS